MNSSRKSVLAALKEASFDPRKPGTVTAIISCNKADYLVERAQEALRDSELFSGAEKRARVRDAVAILAYAMTLIHDPGFCKHAFCAHALTDHAIGLGRPCLKEPCRCPGFSHGP